jgi:hypothetical protein
MSKNFRLLMISAMYENGGNITHRLLDGHPQMFVYPFESQLGTQLVIDSLSSLFPARYRWPVFALDETPDQDYRAIIDQECKVRARTPDVSKFRHVRFDFSDDERREIYLRYISQTGRSRANNVAAFFRATFDAWRDYKRTGRQTVYVGYSPVVAVDTEKIMADFPAAHVLHIVRNPWSAYADTKKRPVPLKLEDYMLGWTVNQYYALLFREKFPGRFHILRTEDIMNNPAETLNPLCERLGLEQAVSLSVPTWNGAELEDIRPWGTIRSASIEYNLSAAGELSREENSLIRSLAGHYLKVFAYDK